ncbi:MAG: hypothetical protein JWM43_3473 [Acidobacteriaceae bacterium]|nr:hypothetical protein [Acidobacteriaceae bacterium]
MLPTQKWTNSSVETLVSMPSASSVTLLSFEDFALPVHKPRGSLAFTMRSPTANSASCRFEYIGPVRHYDPMSTSKKNRIRRVPAATWKTEDLQQRSQQTPSRIMGNEPLRLHAFLDYCRLLQDVRDCFSAQDEANRFDHVFFFLRGGHFAYVYLNETFHLMERAVIFPGLNHARQPRLKFQRCLRSLAKSSVDQGKRTLRLLVIDEVESGSGMGRILKAVEEVVGEPAWGTALQCQLTFYTMRPRQTMSLKLQEAIRKWSRNRKNAPKLLSIAFEHFAGYMPGYDSSRRCGISTVSKRHEEHESYELIRHTEGKLRIVCSATKKRIAFAQLTGATTLVGYLAQLALYLTNKKSGTPIESIASGVNLRGCSICKARFEQVRERSVGWVRSGQ